MKIIIKKSNKRIHEIKVKIKKLKLNKLIKECIK